MKLLISVLFITIITSCSQPTNPTVLIDTELGIIQVELYVEKAPLTVTNFLKNISDKIYDGSQFYRTVKLDNQENSAYKIEVVQGGLFNDSLIVKYPTIKHESTKQTGIKHRTGIISMARSAPGTQSTEFFICLGKQAELDYGGRRNPDGQGFSAFGKVVRGIKIVSEIHQRQDSSQYLKQPVTIKSITIQH